ncbi:hypothetical protein SDC9_125397 [bioreactor metagenome]|jgi:ADP-ribose pyrophosphatase YjhB (NUDIX family)|uniref:Nudix hydrolase domain-containing protein n=1 Tax=bioreactor metagenome TaxID=1076179 RepID=A0A645CMY1_9ZZZZ
MYSIYFDKRILAVCSDEEKALNDPDAVLYSPGSNPELTRLPELFEKSKQIKKLYVPSKQEENTFKQIFTNLTLVQAGGGLVENTKGEFLLIFRNGTWDLPKGKQEPYEDIREAALREVEEECGIHDLELKGLICNTYHTYRMNGKFMIKNTHWYHMIYSGNGSTTPQTEECIEKAIWVKKEKVPKYISDTYPSIREVFSTFLSEGQ